MKKNVIILGGGMSSLVTAFQLTDADPEWRKRYSAITVYQQGWRLGGKGASGRNPDMAHRIEEHGLHLLFGFYENAFRVIRSCYERLGRDWREHFEPQDRIVVPDTSTSPPELWEVRAPRNDKIPGEGEDFLPWDYVRGAIGWIWHQVSDWRGPFEGEPPPLAELSLAETRHELDHLRALEPLEAALDPFRLTRLIDQLAGHMPRLVNAQDPEDLMRLRWALPRLQDPLWNWLTAALGRRRALFADFALTLARGLFDDDLVSQSPDWSRIDQQDLREWLRLHGARTETLGSPFVQGLYDAVFSAYVPLGAGTILNAFLRAAFTYKGAVFYKMHGGMGDVIFAPLYEVLRARGVTFQFFHRVDRLELSPTQEGERRYLRRIHMTRQAEPHKDAAGQALPYDPFIEVDSQRCWPSRPRYELLQDLDGTLAQHDLEDWWDHALGERIALELDPERDLVVLGISIGALPSICEELIEDGQNPDFERMLMSVRTTQTQALQLWFRRDGQSLGWPRPGVPIIPYEKPFDTSADMSHLLVREGWRGDEEVCHLTYHCAALSDEEPVPDRSASGYSARQRDRVLKNARDWLERCAAPLWGKGCQGTGLDWRMLVDRQDRSGSDRLAAQYFCATANPSDRYVLATPGSARYRLGADQSGYPNLILTGDWIRTELNVGCLEAASMAGVEAAKAVARHRAERVDPFAETWPRLPRYIFRYGDLVAPPPVGIDVRRLYTFALQAHPARLRRLCNRYLNHGIKQYLPLGPLVILYCAEMNNNLDIGSCSELDFGFWVPVVGGHFEGSTFVPEDIHTFTPYLWVDNDVALIGGRSVFGFPKHTARMRLPQKPGDASEFHLCTNVLPEFSPRAQVVERPLIASSGRSRGPSRAEL